MTIKFKLDESVSYRVYGETPQESILAGWLSSDIQSSQLAVKQVISKINKIRSGRLSEWTRTGNAYTLSIENNKIFIEDDYCESKVTYEYNFEDIEDAVNSWGKFVRENAL